MEEKILEEKSTHENENDKFVQKNKSTDQRVKKTVNLESLK